MQRRFTPTLTVLENHKLRYAAGIASTDDVNYRVTSSLFKFNGNSCFLRNKLNTNQLEVFDTVSSTVVVDNVGDYSGDIVNIVGLQVDDVVGANSFVKVSVVPANQSAIAPLRNDIIELDGDKSFTRVVNVADGVIN